MYDSIAWITIQEESLLEFQSTPGTTYAIYRTTEASFKWLQHYQKSPYQPNWHNNVTSSLKDYWLYEVKIMFEFLFSARIVYQL